MRLNEELVAICIAVTCGVGMTTGVEAQDDSDLAQKLANPVASLISVPIQANYDDNIGPNDDGSVLRINIQPVVPFTLNDDWNLISRTILPVIFQDDVPAKGLDESGLGDTVQSIFFSPKEPTSGGVILGANVSITEAKSITQRRSKKRHKLKRITQSIPK